jgi:diacylglycerol kinase
MKNNHKSIKSRILDALRGMYVFVKDEAHSIPGFFLQLLLFILLLLFINFGIKPNYTEILIIILGLGIGVVVGCLNTIIEKLCDLYSLEYNPLIRDIKDMAAGACILYFINFTVILVVMYLN